MHWSAWFPLLKPSLSLGLLVEPLHIVHPGFTSTLATASLGVDWHCATSCPLLNHPRLLMNGSIARRLRKVYAPSDISPVSGSTGCWLVATLLSLWPVMGSGCLYLAPLRSHYHDEMRSWPRLEGSQEHREMGVSDPSLFVTCYCNFHFIWWDLACLFLASRIQWAFLGTSGIATGGRLSEKVSTRIWRMRSLSDIIVVVSPMRGIPLGASVIHKQNSCRHTVPAAGALTVAYNVFGDSNYSIFPFEYSTMLTVLHFSHCSFTRLRSLETQTHCA